MRVHSKVALRGLRHRERMQKLNEAAPTGIRVIPAKEEYRKVLKHPRGSAFPETGSVEWPDDRFTKRRLADGSVSRESEQKCAEHNRAPPRPRQQDKDPGNSAT
jgi:hypothetical protein